VLAWLAAIVLAVLAVAALLPGSLSSEGRVTNDPESEQAATLIGERLPRRDVRTELAIVRSETLRVEDAGFEARVRALAAKARATGSVAAADLYYERRDPSLVSPDHHALLIPIELTRDTDAAVKPLIELVKRENGRNGLDLALTGTHTTNQDFGTLSQHDLEAGELQFGLPAALVVLVLVFGALVAAALPLMLALVSIAVALGLTALVAQGYSDLSIFVVNMLTGMGLALGIDYALFVVSRVREERARGLARVDAIAAAGTTASRAVLFSGSAFVLAMIGLLLVQSTIMRSLAVGAILVGVVSVAAALTLLPAVLSLLGDRVNRLRVPLLGREIERETARESRFWTAVVTRVTKRPALSFVLAAALLLVAASPLVGMHIGASGISTLPDSLVSKQGYLALQRSFPGAGADPARIVVDGDVASPTVRGAIRRLEARLRDDRDFGTPELRTSSRGDLALLTVPVSADALSDRAIAAVERLRGEHIPAAFAGVDARVLVGGRTAENVDYFAVMRSWLPIVFVFVLGLSFLLLTLAFRSLVVAGTAIVLNLLSVGAAYGLLVLVFQHGVAAGLLGFRKADTIEAWVPLFLFAVLFGLSMDYQVFLLSRIRERYGQTRDTHGAITFGIGSTARLITGAALIIVVVFVGFAAGDLVMFQQMGFGIAVSLLIDATIVRSVLVPAAMTLLGERNWWLPRWLAWLPHVEVEAAAAEPPATRRPNGR
jgi:RND superfamily putative drug exporter